MVENKRLYELKKRMENLLAINEDTKLRKPLIIEFSGSPKSGKTTVIKQFESFFKDYGFKTFAFIEKASISRISNKQSPDFNMWTTLQICIDLLEISESKKYDIIFIDRGIFDSLCWFKWHVESSQLESKSHKIIEQFVLLKRWIDEINLVFVFHQNSKKTISRDSYKLINETGSILNEGVLDKYNDCILKTYKENKNKFKSVNLIETSGDDYEDIRLEVGNKIIDLLEKLMNEQIGFFPFNKLNIDGIKGVFSVERLLKSELMFEKRELVENEIDFQPIPCAIILNETGEKIFVAKKSEKALEKDSPELDKYLLWIGGHVREDDTSSTYTTLEVLKNTLHREVKEEIGIDVKIDKEDHFCVYTPTSEKSKKHIAVCFVIRINEYINMRQYDDEVLPKYGNSKYGKFHEISCITENFKINDFEDWSQEIGYKLGIFKNIQESIVYK